MKLRRNPYFVVGLTSVILLCVAFGLAENPMAKTDPAAAQTAPVPSVSVIRIDVENISDKRKFIAEVEALNSVDIKPQVTGYIENVYFQEGSFVKQGEMLFMIEQSRYKANLAAAKASLAKAKANLTQLKSDHKRNVSLYNDKALAKADLEVSESMLAQSEANVQAAEASVDLAQIDLEHTEIRAPFGGFIGKALMTKGNYVDGTAPKLARIVQTSPVRIAFSISDKDRLDAYSAVNEAKGRIVADIKLADGRTVAYNNPKSFFESEVNTTTATIPVYFEYENEQRLLLPGNVIEIAIGAEDYKSVVIPASAVLQDLKGNFVMVLNPDNTVTRRQIEISPYHDGSFIVRSGLNGGENIVVKGAQKTTDGMKTDPVFETKA